MQIAISNFRGLADLRATVAPILLLAGANGAGKSSAAMAIAAGASGALLPEGLTKGKAGLLVRDGADLAAVELSTGVGTASVTWPAVERATTGIWGDISEVAAGLIDLAAIKPAERADVLIRLIGATPTADDLSAALVEQGVPDDLIAEAVKQLPKGWDAAHASYKELGAKIKGRWEQATGTRYGKAKAEGWRPDGWKPGMEGLTAEDCADAIARAEDALQEAQRDQGATQAQIDAWQAEADEMGKRRDAVTEARADRDKQLDRELEASKALDTLGARPQPGAEPLLCPCCSNALLLQSGKLVEVDESSLVELAGAAEHWDKMKVKAVAAKEAATLAQRYLDAAEAKLKSAQDAKAKLDAAGGTASDNSTALEAARAELAKAQAVADMRKRVTEATALGAKVNHAIVIVELLDKTGLRQTKLAEALGEFNGELVQVCQSARWKPVHVDSDMAVSYGGRPISLCSAGEQYRARITLQLAVAARERAELVVIDGADILDKAGRNGLFAAIKAQGIMAVIGMTLLKPEEMPDLARAGLGESLWIEGGKASRNVKEAA